MCSQFCFFISIVELPSSIVLFSFSTVRRRGEIDREKDFCIRVDLFSPHSLPNSNSRWLYPSQPPPPPSSFYYPLLSLSFLPIIPSPPYPLPPPLPAISCCLLLYLQAGPRKTNERDRLLVKWGEEKKVVFLSVARSVELDKLTLCSTLIRCNPINREKERKKKKR